VIPNLILPALASEIVVRTDIPASVSLVWHFIKLASGEHGPLACSSRQLAANLISAKGAMSKQLAAARLRSDPKRALKARLNLLKWIACSPLREIALASDLVGTP